MTHLFLKYTGGPPSGANCASMATSFVAEGESALAGLISNYVGMSGCEVTDLTSATSGQGSGGTAWVGTRGTALLSPATAALVNFTISRRYRGGKPRVYLPAGISTDVATSGFWTAGFVSALDTAWWTFLTDVLGSGVGCTIANQVNVGYYHGFTVVTNPITGRSRNVPTPLGTPHIDNVTGFSVNRIIGSQRRRNRDA
jgi:hypothetical protein